MTIVDTSDNVTGHLQFLRGRGVTAIGRYYSASAWKRLTRAEATAISNAGIQIFAVFENDGDPGLSVAQGKSHAQMALDQARGVSQPEGSTIYFALEHLPDGYTSVHVPGAKRYFQGVREILGTKYRAGVYSDGVICDALLTTGLCDHAWLSASTSFEGSGAFAASNRWSLWQRRVDIDWDGLSIDTNDAKAEFGAFAVAAGPGPARAFSIAAHAGVFASSTGAATQVPATGWTFFVQRLREEYRSGKSFVRTVGTYQVFHDGVAVAGLGGMTVERQGPGDDSATGTAEHRCIVARTYPLRSHDTVDYATVGFETDGEHPRPAIGVGDTDFRTGILIHPAEGYGSTIGCINLSGTLHDATSDFTLADSTARVIAVIQDLQQASGGHLPSDGPIGNCRLIVADEALDPASTVLKIGSRGSLVRAWQMFLAAQGHSASAADGDFGPATRAATMAFQSAHGLTSDGIVAGDTLAAAIALGFGRPPAGAGIATSPAGAFDSARAATERQSAARPFRAAFVAAPSVDMAPTPGATVPMRALRRGSHGALVLAWQNFLTGQHFDPGGADGDFSIKTETATQAFQTAQGLPADGVVGQMTFLKAISLGFALVEEPAADDTGSDFPPRPNFPSLQSTSQRWAIFGRFDYVAAPLPDNREHIRILGTWEQDNIISVPIPQLRRTGIPNAATGMRFHHLAAAQLQALWAAWESAGLLDLILTYDGSFEPRFKRGQANGGDDALSNHSFGSAFDINAPFNVFGQRPVLAGERGSVRKLVTIANAQGFFWGGHFPARPDGMHFEVAFIKP